MIYSNWLREKSHNAIKFGEAEGNPCVLKYSKGKKLKNYEIYGNSVQETRSGKNLLKNTAISQRINNVRFTVYPEGGIRVYGTNSSTTDDAVFDVGEFIPDKSSTYTFSGSNSSCSETTFYVLVAFLNGEETVHEEHMVNANALTIDMSTITEELTVCRVSIVVKASVAVKRRDFYLMVELGADKTDYEQYGMMPSPDYPSEIQSLGDSTKNLFDANAEKYDLRMSDTGILSASNYKTIFVNIENIQKFVVSSSFNGTVYCALCDGIEAEATTYNAKDVNLSTTKYSITGNTHKYLGVSIYYTSVSAFNSIQVEEGTTATEYEPYHNKYRIPVEIIKGKNLIDFKDVSVWNKSYLPFVNNSQYYQIKLHEIFPVGTTLTSHFGVTENIPPWLYMQTNDADLPVQSSDSRTLYFTTNSVVRNSLTFTIKEGCFYTLYPANSSISLNVSKFQTWLNKFEYMQIELGSTQSEYEPYSAEVTNIYLDEPLRGIGDYRDYIDFRNKKVVRNIVKMNLSDLLWKTNSTASLNGQFWAGSNFDIIYAEGTNGMSYFLCTDYRVAKYSEYKTADNIIYSSNDTKLIYIKDTDYTDLETFKSEVKGVLIASLATPIEEPIDDLPDIIINNSEVCIIRTDTQVQPSNIKVKYIRL